MTLIPLCSQLMLAEFTDKNGAVAVVVATDSNQTKDQNCGEMAATVNNLAIRDQWQTLVLPARLGRRCRELEGALGNLKLPSSVQVLKATSYDPVILRE